MEVDETLVNGHAGTSCVKEEKMEDEDWDPDEGMSEFYRHHPCARNEPYPSTSREPIKEEEDFNPNDYVLVNTSKPAKSEKKGLTLAFAPDPPVEALCPDEEALMLSSKSNVKSSQASTSRAGEGPAEETMAPWRAGPAKIWYDRAGVPSTASTFDYGLVKRKRENVVDREPEGKLLPAELIEWEDDIIIEGDDFRDEVLDELKYGVEPACGWVPTQYTRTYEQYMLAVKNDAFDLMFQPIQKGITPSPITLAPHPDIITEPSASHSLFPHDFVSQQEHRWEDNVILDPKQVDRITEPKVLSLDYLDDPLIYGMPDDRRSDDPMDSTPNKPFDRKEHQFTKKSKMILGQVQQRQKQEEEEQMETSVAQMTDKDPFNLSNDDYYLPKAINKQPLSKRVIRQFNGRWVEIKKLTKHIKIKEEQREKQRCAEGGGDIFFMRDVADLSGRDGDLVLLEYSEEHPPLLCQPGMASKIKNYYKKKPGKDVDPDFEFGDMAYLHTVPFLGQLQPGQAMQSIENNLFRSAFIYRLFWASEHRPRRLKMDDIKAAFPHYAESSVRKRLKQCSDFKRLGTGPDQNYWVLRPEFRLPSKEEVLAMVTPEMCCAQYSMLAAEQRLKDAGYGEKYFFTPENEDDSDDQVTIEDEDDTPAMPKRLVTGTNADLRKLPLKEAKEICRDYGVREEEINALSRWEIIDVIRTLSTQAAKAKADSSGDHGNVSGMARFARGNIRFNFADMQEKYKKHCQHIFDLQNQLVLIFLTILMQLIIFLKLIPLQER
ncbi:hypothetical protein TELCIR_02957 [Teladorsagia circumcincta]|uniref:Transcription initiation factor TFIID subunit 1 histone acetyltransferase domain-containing protein n=1 Tax=Teladorsagia circumcincta TaxID=45464 RepID=A0A2G9UXR7_TELCI|nr:hypothetical protein TELCIR_02957 [Teladorsagia circumcincta]